MLPEVGASELIVLAAVALIVVGPKDLPVLLRKVGQFVGRMRALAADFRSSFDEMARQSELDELRKEVAALRDTTRFTDTLGAHPTFDEIHHALEGTESKLDVGAMEHEYLADQANMAAPPPAWDAGETGAEPSILPPPAEPAPQPAPEPPTGAEEDRK